MYITPAQLAVDPGVKELAEVATPEHLPVVAIELMHATLTGADRSDWPEEELAAADQALARINSAIDAAAATINGFLQTRGYLPLQTVPALVQTWCRDIARYKLHGNREGDDKDPITRAYNDALKLLRMTSDGKFSLGANDPLAPQGAGMPEFTQGQTTFRDALADY